MLRFTSPLVLALALVAPRIAWSDCYPNGTICSADSQCCSNNCTPGRGRFNHCRADPKAKKEQPEDAKENGDAPEKTAEKPEPGKAPAGEKQ